MAYNWQLSDWTHFQYDADKFRTLADTFLEAAGQSLGVMTAMTAAKKEASLVTVLVKEAIKTSAIEGEMVSREDVISSIKKNLGFETPTVFIRDKRAEGIAQLLVKSRETYADDLSEEMLFEWHRLLMRGSFGLTVGAWRHHNEPMQVISGAIGKETVHFEAPPSHRVPDEMQQFIKWFNQSRPNGDAPLQNIVIRAAIAHLYFESIHPFEDGNGRIGRVIAEKAIAQNLNRPVLMSVSATIEADKKAYYEALKIAQRSNQINDWITYFGNVLHQSQTDFIKTVEFSLKKARFFDLAKPLLNERQEKIIARMLEEDDEFEGGMNAKKYQSIGKTSKATATRDLQDLVEKKIFISNFGGRNTSYHVNWDFKTKPK